MSILANTFDLSQFDEYREDNRREVKKPKVAYQFLYGTLIQLLPTVMVVLLFLVSKKKRMAVGKRPDFRMPQSSAKNFGTPLIILRK